MGTTGGEEIEETKESGSNPAHVLWSQDAKTFVKGPKKIVPDRTHHCREWWHKEQYRGELKRELRPGGKNTQFGDSLRAPRE